MSEWKEYIIDDVCVKLISGGTPLTSKPEYYENGTIPWLKTTEIHKEIIWKTDNYITENGLRNSAAKIIPENSIIIAMYGDGGTAGNVAINKIPLSTNQACCNLIINHGFADYKFVYYYLKVCKQLLVNLKSGGSQQNLNSNTIKKFPISLPSISQQHRIASILSTYDDLIENNNRRIALLEQMAEQIYKEWFVRMRFPGYENAEFEKGIPKGWEIVSFGSIAHFLMGQSPSSEFYNEKGEGLPFHQGVGSYGSRFPKHEIYCSVKGRLANKGDILFSVRAPVGRINIANRKIIIGRGIAAIRHKYNMQSFLFYLLKYYFQDEDLIGNGAIFNSVGKDELYNFKVLCPNNNFVLKYNKIASSIDEQINILIDKTQNLKQTRDLLLPRLISGKLRVKDVKDVSQTTIQ